MVVGPGGLISQWSQVMHGREGSQRLAHTVRSHTLFFFIWSMDGRAGPKSVTIHEEVMVRLALSVRTLTSPLAPTL